MEEQIAILRAWLEDAQAQLERNARPLEVAREEVKRLRAIHDMWLARIAAFTEALNTLEGPKGDA